MEVSSEAEVGAIVKQLLQSGAVAVAAVLHRVAARTP
jgi:hypothetical protein